MSWNWDEDQNEEDNLEDLFGMGMFLWGCGVFDDDKPKPKKDTQPANQNREPRKRHWWW